MYESEEEQVSENDIYSGSLSRPADFTQQR